MIESVVISTPNKKSISLPTCIQNHKLIIDTTLLDIQDLHSFDICITFKNAIRQFRNHDYTWKKCNKDCIANEFTPKIITLNPDFYVQANINAGIWEVKKENPKVLFWRFNPIHSAPITIYSGSQSEKIIASANREFEYFELPTLLFSLTNGIEFSRSINPFSAIVCFTDHCDFDTLESIKLQRAFFKSNGIKVTKGFFLNHFSKRKDNASFENETVELTQWKNDGHELAYHSLSQSLKSDEESFADFYSFKPPFNDIPTWIDHGYQAYNFSLFQNKKISETVFSETLKSKNISTLWNYIDTGTASLGVINQLNVEDFTLKSFYKGIKKLPLKDKVGLMIKNIIYHYYADAKIIIKYKNTATSFKKIIYEKKISALFTLMKNILSISVPILTIFVLWNKHKNKPYKLAKYSPLFFKHSIDKISFNIFQTIEMVDFRQALQKENIDKIITEKGIFIAHTYFAVPMKYHTGRMFDTPNKIDTVVAHNFNYLGNKIKNKEIWNPTLNELNIFLSNFEKTVLDIDFNGKVIVKNPSGLSYREVN